MGAARPALGLASLILTAGAIVLQFFVILGGAVSGSVLRHFYFLSVDTTGIDGARNPARWTLWNICEADNTNCGAIVPAHPFDPVRNFGTESGVPDGFIGTSKFFFLSRFAFAFILISLFFAACSLFLGLFALCSRIGSYLSSALVAVSAFFMTLAAALITAAYVIGRDNFIANGQTATLGRYNFGFIWAAVAALGTATILFCIGGAASRKDTSYSRKNGFLGRKKSTRSRGSFIDNDASSFQRA